ncbi:MAG: ABC transporter substrate-binding protein [Elusimicrobia bacterium]|nr:ABC transporter substrate-binding protein [Elusimicrobiota bacterium]
MRLLKIRDAWRAGPPLVLVCALASFAASPGSAVLRVCDDVVPPASLDPQKEFSEKNHTIIQQIFDGLVRFDPEGDIEPALAESWRWIEPLRLEFKLRKGVRFHNGEPFDARAAAFSIGRFVDPRGGFPGAGFLDSIDEVEAADTHVLRIKTKYPDGVLLHRLAGLVSMMPAGFVAQHGEAYFGEHPVGTGAFKFVRWDKESREIVLEANEDYWLKGNPKFQGLVFRFLSVEEQVEALLKGEVDIVTELPGTETLKVMKSGTAGIVKKESFYTVASSVNGQAGPMADRRVRRAVNYAIDKDQLIRYDVLGNGRPMASLTMEGEIGHNGELRPYPYDLGKASRLLREAGYGGGLRLKAVVKAQGMRTMKIIAKQLEKAGILIDIHETNDANVIRDIQAGGWDFTFGGCPDPMAHSFFIQFIFLSSMSPYSILGDRAFDERLQRMAGTLDPGEQQRLGAELDRYVHEEALSLFTFQRIKTYGVGRTVHFVPSVTGMPYFHLSAPRAP